MLHGVCVGRASTFRCLNPTRDVMNSAFMSRFLCSTCILSLAMPPADETRASATPEPDTFVSVLPLVEEVLGSVYALAEGSATSPDDVVTKVGPDRQARHLPPALRPFITLPNLHTHATLALVPVTQSTADAQAKEIQAQLARMKAAATALPGGHISTAAVEQLSGVFQQQAQDRR